MFSSIVWVHSSKFRSFIGFNSSYLRQNNVLKTTFCNFSSSSIFLHYKMLNYSTFSYSIWLGGGYYFAVGFLKWISFSSINFKSFCRITKFSYILQIPNSSSWKCSIHSCFEKNWLAPIFLRSYKQSLHFFDAHPSFIPSL